jgi:hypothetical protein
MRSPMNVARVRRLADIGVNYSQIARLTGVSRPAIRAWLRPESPRLPVPTCEECGHEPHRFDELPESEYSSRSRPLQVVACLSPQHGPGHEHERKIELAPWQEAIVDREPERFILGLIHSDGCRVINRVVVDGKEYAYPRYFFTQVSKDIQALFCRSCDRLGIEYGFSGSGKDATIHRRESVGAARQRIRPVQG